MDICRYRGQCTSSVPHPVHGGSQGTLVAALEDNLPGLLDGLLVRVRLDVDHALTNTARFIGAVRTVPAAITAQGLVNGASVLALEDVAVLLVRPVPAVFLAVTDDVVGHTIAADALELVGATVWPALNSLIRIVTAVLAAVTAIGPRDTLSV